MIDYLKAYFQPGSAEPGFSLAIQGGSQGARLTHSHERQVRGEAARRPRARGGRERGFRCWCGTMLGLSPLPHLLTFFFLPSTVLLYRLPVMQYNYVLQSLTLWRETSHEASGMPCALRRAALDCACWRTRAAAAFRSHPLNALSLHASASLPLLSPSADVQAVVSSRQRPAAGGQSLPPAEHGAGPEPRAGRARR